jgi:hypothetical protein
MKKNSPTLYVVVGVFSVLFLYLATRMSRVEVKEKRDVSEAEMAVQKMVGSNN